MTHICFRDTFNIPGQGLVENIHEITARISLGFTGGATAWLQIAGHKLPELVYILFRFHLRSVLPLEF